MFAFVLLQLAFDFLVIGLVVFYFLKRANSDSTQIESQLGAALKVMEIKFHEIEAQSAEQRSRLDAQLSKLAKLCVEAATLVDNQKTQDLTAPTFEENELRSAVQHRDVIPTLKQIEKTKERLHQDLRVDLRSLLRDQLV